MRKKVSLLLVVSFLFNRGIHAQITAPQPAQAPTGTSQSSRESTRTPTITFNGKDVSLTKIFAVIKEQTGYLVFYNPDQIQYKNPVTISAKKKKLEDFLKEVLRDQGLDYIIENKTIVISQRVVRAQAQPMQSTTAPVAEDGNNVNDVTGYVLDSLGHPLYGATVQVEGSRKGTETNEKGFFTLHNAPDNLSLIFSYAAYESKVVRVREDRYISVVLKPNMSPLDQTIVQAYGTTSRRFSVGSIGTVTAAQIEKQPVTNVLMALEGQVAGLSVTPTNGAPGSTVQLQIRGQNTLQSNPNTPVFDQPLFIIDGVPFAPQNGKINALSTLASSTNYNNSFGGMSPFNSINPTDIESISILKDADATSIYGTQGAHGVVLITTKKGKAGRTDFNLSVNTGPNKITRQVHMLNTQQYLQLRREAIANDGNTPNLTQYSGGYAPDLLIFDSTKYTDWFHEYFGGTSNNTDVHASLSGGSANTTFIATAGYTRSTYNFPGDFAENRYSLHSGVHHNSTDHRLSIDLGTDYSYDRNNSTPIPNLLTALLLPPDNPNLTDPNGKLVWSYKGVDVTSGTQMAAGLRQPAVLQTFNLMNSLRVGYQLFSGFNLSVNAGYSRLNTIENNAAPSTTLPPTYAMSQANFGNNTFQTINIEPQLDYKLAIGRGVLTALAGATYKKNFSSTSTTNGSGYPNDALLGSLAGATTITASVDNSIYKYDAAYGRIGYIYEQKYIISLTGRRDGSSNFGPGRQFGNFGSIGMGWIFSEEEVFKKALPFISYAKLYGNYGTSGSDATSPYQYQAFWQPVQYVASFQNISPYVPTNLLNPDYSWDTKKSWNVALDLGFFHDRLLLNATWYRSRIGNQLTGYPLPVITGFGSVVENFNATIQNAGWEFTLSSTNIRKKNFSWSSSFNISFNRNKLIAFPGLASSPYASTYFIGKSTSIRSGYRYKGVNDTTGLFQFYTAKGTPTYSPNYLPVSQGGDWQPLVDLQPKFTGGLGNTLSYKAFSLTLFFQFSKQMGYNYLYSVYTYGTPGSQNNAPVQVLNHWRQPGDHSDLQRATAQNGSQAFNASYAFISSSGVYSDASYIRLKTLSFAYALPDAALKKLNIKSFRFYINAQNLLTFTGYKVGDPEIANLYAIPIQRTVTGGISFNF